MNKIRVIEGGIRLNDTQYCLDDQFEGHLPHHVGIACARRGNVRSREKLENSVFCTELVMQELGHCLRVKSTYVLFTLSQYFYST